ncbi:hypothetical protein DL766_004671 [Monosporascus sp. MC13-8B]|nr:hypothetical protein DL763_010685 [Monosporascus cannonballus]RYP30867.1 hypothetical protein DL766_004671 [Monosporascus sp. MC13-8B]
MVGIFPPHFPHTSPHWAVVVFYSRALRPFAEGTPSATLYDIELELNRVALEDILSANWLAYLREIEEYTHMMEVQQRATAEQAQPHQIGTILQNIDELVREVLSKNEAILCNNAESLDEASLRARQSMLETFKNLMVEVQRKASKAIHEVESKLGPSVQAEHVQAIADASLQDLPGLEPDDELNRILGRAELNGKQSYKLREFLPPSFTIPEIATVDGDMLFKQRGDHVVVLQPTLRNVWVIQHAYTKLLKHKEGLIKRYLDKVDPKAVNSRKFSREYYENLSLANLPSKNKLGQLLDVKTSTYGDTTDGMMIILTFPVSRGGFEFIEAVTGDSVVMNDDIKGSNLILPVTEASIRKLHGAYRSIRKATSDERRASKDKLFAATLPVNEVDELEKQFNFPGGGEAGETATGRKRRRMLDDDAGRD